MPERRLTRPPGTATAPWPRHRTTSAITSRTCTIPASGDLARSQRCTTLERSASGFTAFTLSAVNSATIGVSFPAGRFLPSDQLTVHVSKWGGQLAKFVPYCNSISATGMTIGLYSGDGSAGTGNVNVFWTVELRRP